MIDDPQDAPRPARDAAAAGTRPPRVLQVVLSLQPGGTERLVVDLVTRLHPAMPMMVCCLDEAGRWAAPLEAAGVEVRALGRRPGLHLSTGHAVAAAVRAHGATVVHAHHYSPFVYSAVAKLESPRTPIVFTEHGKLSDTPPSRKRRLANRVLSWFPSRVATVSQDLKNHLVLEGFRPQAIDVIYNGIRVGPLSSPGDRAEVRRSLGVEDDVLVVGTVARLDPVKDLGTLLAAVAAVARERPVRLVVIGDGPERASLERTADELGVKTQVDFLGHREDARRWLAGCDVFANSSRSEGVSLTILEGMAAALPVVVTAVGGTPEVVPRECGRLVPARDAGAFAAALRELADDPVLRTRLGRAGRQHVERSFSIEQMVEAYRRIYVEVA